MVVMRAPVDAGAGFCACARPARAKKVEMRACMVNIRSVGAAAQQMRI